MGKELVAVATVDHLVLLVEYDTSNPAVWTTYRDFTPRELVKLDEAAGSQLVNVCDTNPESFVVVIMAARNNVAAAKFADALERSVNELGRDLVSLWVINRLNSEQSLRDLFRVLPSWPRSRVLELAPKYWKNTRDRIDPAEFAMVLGPPTVPPPLPTSQAEE